MKLSFVEIPEGFRVFNGDNLVAIVTTSQHMTDAEVKEAIAANRVKAEFAVAHGKGYGPVAWKLMPPEGWSVHFTRPSVPVELLKAVVAGIYIPAAS